MMSLSSTDVPHGPRPDGMNTVFWERVGPRLECGIETSEIGSLLLELRADGFLRLRLPSPCSLIES